MTSPITSRDRAAAKIAAARDLAARVRPPRRTHPRPPWPVIDALLQITEPYTDPVPRTMARILEVVASEFGVSKLDIESARRTVPIVRARQAAMMIGRRYTRLSLPQIGARIGKRDHTTVLWGVRQAEARATTDPEYAAAIERCRNRL